MIYDITTQFLEARSRYHASKLLGSLEQELPGAQSPPWLTLAQSIRQEIDSIAATVTSIEDKQRQRERSLFDQALTQEINLLTERVTQQIRAAQNRVAAFKTLAYDQKDREALVLHKSVHQSLQNQLKKQATRFRSQQAQYMEFLRSLEQQNLGGLDPAAEEGAGLDEETAGIVKQSSMEIQLREKEIYEIARSVEELAEMAQQLADMVQAQGTMLDRIDQNMTDALAHAEQGVMHLEDARKTQKTLNKLRIATYAILGVDYIMLIVYFILKAI